MPRSGRCDRCEVSHEDACRELLEGRRLALVVDAVAALRTSIDPKAVFGALRVGLEIREWFLAVDREWLDRKEEALADVSKAIRKFKGVLRSAPPAAGVSGSDMVRTWASGLSFEYERLRGLYLEGDGGRPGYDLMVLDRTALGAESKPGRPHAVWHERAFSDLRAAGVPVLAARRLLRDAGLTAARMTRKAEKGAGAPARRPRKH
jgi:hypothetical protein